MSDTSSKQEPVNRTRRAVYVFGVTGWCLVCPVAAVYMGYDTPLAEIVVKAMLGIVPILIGFYLSTSTIDRSNILSSFGKAKVAEAETPEKTVSRRLVKGDTIGTEYRRTYG